MSSLMAQAIDKLMAQDDEFEQRKRQFLEGMRKAPDLGTGGKIPWTRDQLHER